MTQPQHLAALCFVCALKNLTTQADRPLPGLHVDHEGCSCLSMLSLALFPATIASERELALTLTLILLQLTVGARRRGEERLPAALRCSHHTSAFQAHAHMLLTKVSIHTCKNPYVLVGLCFLEANSLRFPLLSICK